MELLPSGQAAILKRTGDLHGYATISVRSGLAVTARDHQMVRYRVLREWPRLTEDQRAIGSLAAFKRGLGVGYWRMAGCFVEPSKSDLTARLARWRRQWNIAGIVWTLPNRLDKLASLLATVLKHTWIHTTCIASCGTWILTAGPIDSFEHPKDFL